LKSEIFHLQSSNPTLLAMSFLTSIRAGSRRAMQTSYTIPSTPAFSTSAAQRTLKESDKSQPPPNIPIHGYVIMNETQ
jgi:hypothetical protein